MVYVTGLLIMSIALRFIFKMFKFNPSWDLCLKGIGGVTTCPNEIFSICIWITMSLVCFGLLKEVYRLQVIKPFPWIPRWLKISSMITTVKEGSGYRCRIFLLLIIAMLTYQVWMIIHVYLMYVIELMWLKQLGLLMPVTIVPLHTVLQVYFLFYYRWCSYRSNLTRIKYFVIPSCFFNLAMVVHLVSVIVTTVNEHFKQDGITLNRTLDMSIGLGLAALEVVIRFCSCYRLWHIYKKYEPDTPNDTKVAVSSCNWTDIELVAIASEYRNVRTNNNDNNENNHLHKPLPCTEPSVMENSEVVNMVLKYTPKCS